MSERIEVGFQTFVSDSPEEFAAGISRALEQREDLVRRGFDHASRFTWLETGRVHLQGYAEAL